MLPNKRHEAFAQAVADGASAAASYRNTYPKCSESTAETTGPALLRESQIALRVAELRQIADDVATERVKFTKQEALGYLADIVRTPVEDIDASSPLCQEYTTTDRKDGGSVKVKMPSKLDALKLMAQLCGWNAPEKQEVKLTGPRSVLSAILTRTKP